MQHHVRIPFVVGLSAVRVIASEAGDYEMLRLIDSIDATGHRIAISGEAADDGKGLLEVRIVRVVRAEDQRASRKMRVYFHTGDAQVFPGTVPGFSAAVVNDLRTTGQSAFTYVDVSSTFGLARTVSCPARTTHRGPATLPMLSMAAGAAAGDSRKGQPLDGAKDQARRTLSSTCSRSRQSHRAAMERHRLQLASVPHRVSRVECDRACARRQRAGRNLGIRFSFARADIRPQSERVLKRSPRCSMRTRTGSCVSMATPMASATLPRIWSCPGGASPQ